MPTPNAPSGPNPSKAASEVHVRSLTCPGCGGPVSLRSFGQAVNAACENCHSILDAQDPNLKILQQVKATEKFWPLIPLGKRGKLRGTVYEAIGYQYRRIQVDGVTYGWSEYVLFNPYQGFRYLSEYDGHWNYVSPLRSLPKALAGVSSQYLGQTYRHFQTSDAKTSYVIGEFPWQVRVGETVEVTDYVAPPRVLSSETTGDKETTWSLGEYMNGSDLWKAFSLPGEPPPAIGVYENQPAPLGDLPKSIWKWCAAFLVGAVLLVILNAATSHDKTVFNRSFSFDTSATGEPSFVTDVFEVTGRSAPVKVETDANVNNNWIYLNYALINEDTGQAYDFGREVSYYYGRDSDGSWTEGSTHNSVTLPSIPPGHYFLRIEPESDRGHGTIAYTVTVSQGAVVVSWFLIAIALLVVPAVMLTWRSMSFEHLRWQESDHPKTSLNLSQISSGDDD